MLLHESAEFKQKRHEIIEAYAVKVNEAKQAAENAKGAEKEELTRIYKALLDESTHAFLSYVQSCEEEEFKKIKGGTKGILKHAQKLLPKIIEGLEREQGDIFELATKGGAIVFKNDEGGEKIQMKADYALTYIKYHLRLHIEALEGDAEASKKLFADIAAAVNACDFVEDITDGELQPEDVNSLQFRRKPLTKIKTYGLMNDKINAQLLQDSTDIFQQEADGQLTLRWEIMESGKNEDPIPVYVALTYEGEGLKISKKLTAFDKQVYEAIGTRFYYARQEDPNAPLCITPQEIWRTMNGKSTSDSKVMPTEKQEKRICESMHKMRFTSLIMDITEEINRRNYAFDDDRIIGGTINTYLLKCDEVNFITENGRKLHGYKIDKEPILYTYNRIKDRLLYVPYEMLDTSAYTSEAENVAEFKGYLLQQIQLMKNAKEQGKKGNYFKRNSTILIETIYRETGIQTPEERIEGNYANEATKQQAIRRARKTDREKIEKILDAWKAKAWIKGYEAVKNGTQTRGYDIKI